MSVKYDGFRVPRSTLRRIHQQHHCMRLGLAHSFIKDEGFKKFGKRNFAFSFLFCTVAISTASGALGANQPVSTAVVSVVGAPVTRIHCGVDLNVASDVLVNVDAVNRSDVFLTSYVVRWFLYDHAGTIKIFRTLFRPISRLATRRRQETIAFTMKPNRLAH